MDEASRPARVGDVVCLPIAHCAGVLAALRDRAPRPMGVPPPVLTPGAGAFLRLVEAGARDHALRRMRATPGQASAGVAPPPAPPRSAPDRGAWTTAEVTVSEGARLVGVSQARIRAMAAGGQLAARRTIAPPRPGQSRRPRWAICRTAVENYAATRRQEDQ